MGNPQNIKRWGLFRTDGPHDAVRRYQLARLEEVALAYPVPGSEPPLRSGTQSQPPGGGGAPPPEPGT